MHDRKVDLLLASVLVAAASLAGCGGNDGTPAPTVKSVRVDRMAVPMLNMVLVPANLKNAFNASSPETDVANGFRTVIQSSITSLRAAVQSSLPPEDSPGVPAVLIANIVIPDVVRVDFTKPVQFPNGRRPEDDVADVALGLALNRGNVLGTPPGPGVPDDIDANDVPFLGTFPYLAAPH